MAVSNFSFFAMSYLDDWVCDDRQFVEGLDAKRPQDERLEMINKAAKYYKVSRTLKTLPGEKRLERALAAVDAAANSLNGDNIDSVVCDLAATLQAAYGTYAVSAASKFLWLRRQSPVVIYDSRAVQCLDKACNGALGVWCEYSDYRARWIAEFEKSAKQIGSACDKLVRVKEFSLANELSDDQITVLTRSRWFQERVFDKYLWWNASD